jgi:undecaprenyl-diphosphatase
MEDKKWHKGNSSIKKYALPLIVLAVFLLSFIFDSKIVMLVSKLRNPILDFMFSIPYLDIALIACLPTIFLFFSNKKDILKYWFSLALTLFVIILIKMVIHRERPFQELDLSIPESMIKASYSTWDFSFPSNHTALSFIALPFLEGKFFIIWLVLAMLLAFSRLYFGLHYLSDVIASMMIGYFIYIFVRKYIK